MMECLMGSLHDMIDEVSEHDNTSATIMITTLKQLLSCLEGLHHVIACKMHSSALLDLIGTTFAGLIDRLLIWMVQLLVLFLVECGFVDYDPNHFPGCFF